jgi:hypothetical protein
MQLAYILLATTSVWYFFKYGLATVQFYNWKSRKITNLHLVGPVALCLLVAAYAAVMLAVDTPCSPNVDGALVGLLLAGVGGVGLSIGTDSMHHRMTTTPGIALCVSALMYAIGAAEQDGTACRNMVTPASLGFMCLAAVHALA